jgi:diguanylate cyclase (GGDEF)-like protein
MTAVSSDDDRPAALATGRGGRLEWQRRLWSVVAVLVVVGGCAAAVVLASVQSSDDVASARQAFRSSSAQVASALKLAIQHETDLIVSADGFLAGNPDATNAQFGRWVHSVQALKRYPEIIGLGHSVVVPAAKLAAFAKAARRDPTGPLSANGAFKVIPAGRRPFYCLSVGSVTRTPRDAFPAGYDFCDGDLGRASRAARDSGASAYVPIKAGPVTLLSILAPVYRGGLVPSTVPSRRAGFLGWVGMPVIPAVLLDRALVGHPGMAVTFSYHGGSSNVSFGTGDAPKHPQSATIELHNGWTVRAIAAAPATGLFAGGRPTNILIVGVVMSLLLGALVLVLATGKRRAQRLVDLKTSELSHQALHDPLTGLPNRALITDRVDQLLARSRRTGRPGAVLFVDLDEFKNVNDTLGHEAGDQLLQAAAERLTSGLRDVDTIGRLGGDEFVVLIDGGSHAAPDLVAERLLELMRQPFELKSSPTPIIVAASVGIAAGDRGTAGDLLRDADMALYRAKATGKNCYQAFRPEMESALRQTLELENDLRSALTHDQFRLVYQPIYNLDDLTLVGVEALLRWDHPTRGVLLPDEFIGLLESSGQILEVGRWVLAAACRQMTEWHMLGSTLGISVNVSARQLDDDIIVTDIRDALKLSALDPTKLTIEITETAVMSNLQATKRRLQEIKALNVNLAIDDFGTSYSSLASLQQLPIDTIKLDRTFTDALKRSPQSSALIRILAQLGKDLGLNTLAEGVETIDQLDQLRNEQVHEVQGFLLSKPLDPAAIEELMVPELTPDRPHTT